MKKKEIKTTSVCAVLALSHLWQHDTPRRPCATKTTRMNAEAWTEMMHMKLRRQKREYYKTRQEAMAIRSPGDRIFYDADEQKYYIVKANKKPFWNI